MALFTVSDPSKAQKLAHAYLWHAYQLCGIETGMGFLQKVASLSIDDVPRHCHARAVDSPRHDYWGSKAERAIGAGWHDMHADYLAGRMVKAIISYSEDGFVSISGHAPDPEFQGWSGGEVRSYRDLLNLAAKTVETEVAPIS